MRPNINWLSSPYTATTKLPQRLSQFQCYKQMVDTSTHAKSNILDLILTSLMPARQLCIVTTGYSRHSALIISLESLVPPHITNKQSSSKNRLLYNFRQANKDGIYNQRYPGNIYQAPKTYHK